MEGSSPCITSADNIPLGFEPGEPSSMNKCSRFLCAEGLGGSLIGAMLHEYWTLEAIELIEVHPS